MRKVKGRGGEEHGIVEEVQRRGLGEEGPPLGQPLLEADSTGILAEVALADLEGVEGLQLED